jgi:cytochrome bd-type quinol oxidase subunit 2
VTHGGRFLALKTTGDLRATAVTVTWVSPPVTGLMVLAFALWTHAIAGKGVLINPVVAGIFLPVVLAYTAWSYYVFKRRLSDKDFRVQRSAH